MFLRFKLTKACETQYRKSFQDLNLISKLSQKNVLRRFFSVHKIAFKQKLFCSVTQMHCLRPIEQTKPRSFSLLEISEVITIFQEANETFLDLFFAEMEMPVLRTSFEA